MARTYQSLNGLEQTDKRHSSLLAAKILDELVVRDTVEPRCRLVGHSLFPCSMDPLFARSATVVLDEMKIVMSVEEN
jgi:hypothetical protein